MLPQLNLWIKPILLGLELAQDAGRTGRRPIMTIFLWDRFNFYDL
jgi:hypothetical protein